ncbi:MAG: flagellar motor switch protein FliM [Phycisphaerales bacterium]
MEALSLGMDLLDQNEVEALLAAVEQDQEEDSGPVDKIFSRRIRRGQTPEVKEYDFKRPERVSKDQMRSIQTLHETFARSFGASLSGFLRTIVEVKVAHVAQMTYYELISSLPNPTSFNLIEADEFEGRLCLEISPLIIYPIIDRLMGGSNRELFVPQRPQTVIETRLISKITDRAMEAMREAWQGVRDIKFRLTETESNPQLVQIVPPNEVVVVVGFELKLGNRAGTMNLCIPYAVIEPFMEDLASQSWFNSTKVRKASETMGRLSKHLSGACVTVTGLLAETTISLGDLMSLSVGDLIVTEKEATRPALVCVEGEKKMFAEIGRHKGNRALKIVRPIKPSDRV